MKKKKWKILLCVLLSLFVVKMGANCFFPYISFSGTSSSGIRVCVFSDAEDVSLRRYVYTGFWARESGRFYLQWEDNGDHTIYFAELLGVETLVEIKTFNLKTFGIFSWMELEDRRPPDEMSIEERLYIFNLLRTNDILMSSDSHYISNAIPEADIAEGLVPIGIKTDLLIEKAGYPDYCMNVEQVQAAEVFSYYSYNSDYLSWLYDCDEYWCYNISQNNARDVQYSVVLGIKDNVVKVCEVDGEKLP